MRIILLFVAAVLARVLSAKAGLPAEEVALTQLATITGGTFWYGSQLTIGDKLIPNGAKDGSNPRVKKTVHSFQIDMHAVTNLQFSAFVNATKFVSEAEKFKWSFVLEQLASQKVIKQVDSKKGHGRVKDSTHWMAVPKASWAKPYGRDSPNMLTPENRDLPVVHVSYNDAVSYCKWANRRLPTELEWEYAARGGRSKQNYPWGDELKPLRMNIWEGNFPTQNTLQDGYLGPAPVKTYTPNAYGLYNMVSLCYIWGSCFIHISHFRKTHLYVSLLMTEHMQITAFDSHYFLTYISIGGECVGVGKWGYS